MDIIKDLQYRELLQAVTDERLSEHLAANRVVFYLGADPSDSSLHVGHLVPYMIAKRLAAAGHKPIMVIGGGTGLIGDPSGRESERKLLTLEETMENARSLAGQVERIIPEAEIVNNYDWLKNYDMVTFLRDVGKHFNINTMMAKDSVRNRLESGISFTEFSYQIIQAIDFHELFVQKGCTLQIGGGDQWGNITAGLDYIRRREGADKGVYGLVAPLVTKKDGTKFGKTGTDTVWLDPERTSPYAFYQYWINLDDDEALIRLRQFTSLSREEIEEIADNMAESPHLRHAQKRLAAEVTLLVHGKEGLAVAERITEALFGGDITRLSAREIAMGLENVPHAETSEAIPLVDALVETGLAPSKREARTLIKQNAVSVNGEKNTDTEALLEREEAIEGVYHVLRRGKKHYGLLRHVR